MSKLSNTYSMLWSVQHSFIAKKSNENYRLRFIRIIKNNGILYFFCIRPLQNILGIFRIPMTSCMLNIQFLTNNQPRRCIIDTTHTHSTIYLPSNTVQNHNFPPLGSLKVINISIFKVFDVEEPHIGLNTLMSFFDGPSPYISPSFCSKSG